MHPRPRRAYRGHPDQSLGEEVGRRDLAVLGASMLGCLILLGGMVLLLVLLVRLAASVVS
jgi:hypothetical protein